MIDIKDKKDCCGCSACVQVCPKQCISMNEDEEGFLYPKVKTDLCINCHLCEKVCPVINQDGTREPLAVYAAKNTDDSIRLNSSSGGIFTLLSEYIINNGGVVFGAKFNKNWEVVHDYTETKEGIAPFKSSKYVQSRIGSTFKEAEKFLKQGRQVLFSGTPCQIAGLKKYLRKDYDNLLSVEVVCHGVPSPEVWQYYLNGLCKEKHIDKDSIKHISFRNKVTGWKDYTFSIEANKNFSHYSRENSFMRGFLSDLYLRPSCHDCPAKHLKSGSDILLCDYWGIQNIMPEFDDDKGVSGILVNTEKGRDFINKLTIELRESNFKDIATYNPSMLKSVKVPEKRSYFFNNYQSDFALTVRNCTTPSFSTRVKNKLKSIIIRFIKH